MKERDLNLKKKKYEIKYMDYFNLINYYYIIIYRY